MLEDDVLMKRLKESYEVMETPEITDDLIQAVTEYARNEG